MTEEKDLKVLSSFWRRLAALFIDTIILGIAGQILGFIFERQFVELGSFGRGVGFLIALAYFGILNSKHGLGQTIGKRLTKIKVVDANNQTIDVTKSFIRFSILGTPFFLNGIYFSSTTSSVYLLYLFSTIVFGGMISIIYLYIFNRVTRQSLHDLLVGTFVINVGVIRRDVRIIWMPHLLVVGLFFIIAVTLPVLGSRLAQQEPFTEMSSAQTAIMANPLVRSAGLFEGKSFFSSSVDGTRTVSYVSVKTLLKNNSVNDDNLAKQIARTLVSHYPSAMQKDSIQVILVYGFDIGIASKWQTSRQNFNPKELGTK